jgi:hypothetical protein
MTASSPRKGAAAFPPGSPSCFLPLERAIEVHEVFHHGALCELVLDGVHMVWTGRSEKFLKVIVRLPRLALEITLGSHDMLLIRAIRFLVIAAGSNCDSLGHRFCPFFLPLALLLVHLTVALGGAPRLPLGTIFPSP